MLANAIKNLSKHSLVYACSSYLTKIIGFFLIPFYAHYLPPAPYGKMEIFDFSIVIIGHLIGINVGTAMVKYYLASDDPNEKRRVVSTTIIFATLASLVAIGILSLFSRNFSVIFFDTPLHSDWIIIIFLNLFLTVVTHQCFNYLQANRLSHWFLAISVGKLVLEVSLRIIFIVKFDMGFMGVFLGSLAGGAPFTLLLLFVILWKSRFCFSFTTLRKLLLFTAPLVLSGVGQAFLHGGDRFLVLFMAGAHATGIYAMAYKFGYLANALVVSPFLLIWFPYILSVRDDKNVCLICSRIQTYFTLLVGFASFSLAVFSREIVVIMTEEKYFGAYRALPFILAGYFFWAMFQIVQSVFFVKAKTHYLSWIIGISVALNFGLNFLFIPVYGFVGASVVTAITFSFLLAITYFFAQRNLSIRYEIRRLLKIASVALILFWLSTFIPWSWGFVLNFCLKGLIVGAYPFVLYFIGFLIPEEKERLFFILGVIRRGPGAWRTLLALKTWFK